MSLTFSIADSTDMTPDQEAAVRKIFQEELKKAFPFETFSDRFVISRDLQMQNGIDIQTGRGAGTMIATSADQKIGFFGKTPVVRPATPSATASAIIALLQAIGLSA